MTARLDELRQKFEENPRRYFAPLANEYRKSGDHDRAIELCRTQLAAFPEHISGHIVLGQALFEAGRLDEARRVFEVSAGLDPENVIALRHLGDIARTRGDDATARRWYQRILEADPRNDDIAAQLASLVGSAPPGPTAPTTATPPRERAAHAASGVDTSPAPAPADTDGGFVDGWELPAVPSGTAARADRPLAPNELEAVFDIVAPTARDAATTESPDGVDTTDPDVWPDGTPLPDALIEPFEPVVGLDLPPSQAAAEPERETVPPPVDAPNADLAPLVDFEAIEADTDPHIQVAQMASPEAGAGAAGDAGAPVGAAAEGDDARVDAEDLLALGSGAFATETLAELFVQQGHYLQARSVYTRLVAERPGDAALAARLADVDARLGGPVATPEPAEPEAAASADEEYKSGVTNEPIDLVDQSVASLSAEPEPEPEPQPEPEPEPRDDRAPGLLADLTPDAMEQPGAVAEAEVTAGAFFAALAARSLAPPATVAEAPNEMSEPAWSPFGAGTAGDPDERAASVLAAAFAAPSAGAPSLADEVARSAAPAEPLGATAGAAAGAASSLGTAASDDLSFDRFFAGFAGFDDLAPPPDAPTFAAPDATAPAEAAASGARDDASPPRDRQPAGPDALPAAADDDLTEFNAWLRGLGDL